jgi:hypothetical protein
MYWYSSGMSLPFYQTTRLHKPGESSLLYFKTIHILSLMLYKKKNSVFWDVAPCISCMHRRFGGPHRHLLTLVPRSRIFLLWRRRRYVPPKRRFKQDLHSATAQKATFFIATAVKTSDLTSLRYILMLCLHLPLGLASDVFPSAFQAKILYAQF